MFGKALSKLVVYLLKHKTLKAEDKMRVTNALLKNLHAVPVKDVITADEQGGIMIGTRKLNLDEAQAFLVSLQALKDNMARKVLQEQISYEAIKMGIHNGLSPDTILFAKAVLWYIGEENRKLAELSLN